MRNDPKTDSLMLTRRAFGAGLAAGTGFLAFALPVRALTVDQARALIDKAVAAVNEIINSGKPVQQMYGDFERVFINYADVPTIARSALGVAAKSADRKSTRLNSSHSDLSRMPSSA